MFCFLIQEILRHIWFTFSLEISSSFNSIQLLAMTKNRSIFHFTPYKVENGEQVISTAVEVLYFFKCPRHILKFHGKQIHYINTSFKCLNCLPTQLEFSLCCIRNLVSYFKFWLRVLENALMVQCQVLLVLSGDALYHFRESILSITIQKRFMTSVISSHHRSTPKSPLNQFEPPNVHWIFATFSAVDLVLFQRKIAKKLL